MLELPQGCRICVRVKVRCSNDGTVITASIGKRIRLTDAEAAALIEAAT